VAKKIFKCDFLLSEVGRLLENDALFRESLREVVGGHDEFAVFALRFGSLKRDENVSDSMLKPGAGVFSYLTSASNSETSAVLKLTLITPSNTIFANSFKPVNTY
jgi:hypothetical protein